MAVEVSKGYVDTPLHCNRSINTKIMDALAGYGSDSNDSMVAGDSIDLLGHYSSSSGDDGKRDDCDGAEEKQLNVNENNSPGDTLADGDQPKKRRRRWDNPDGAKINNNILNADCVLPPPTFLSTSTTDDHPFQSLTLFKKDHTTDLRVKIAQQLQSHQTLQDNTEASSTNIQLNTLRENFSSSSTKSFANHLKSQHDFGNPYLLKNVIDHFGINPLESHVGNTFKSFEQVHRLIQAEERVRCMNMDTNTTF